MKNYRQLATTLGGLTVLTAALLAQTPPAPTSAVAPGAVPGLVNPPIAPAVPPVIQPPDPINPSPPSTPHSYTPPVVPAGATAAPATINPTSTSATGALHATGGIHPVAYSIMDSDGDGKVSAAEYSKYLSRTAAASPKVSPNTSPAAKRGSEDRVLHGDDKTGTTGAGVRSNQTFIDLDTNHDSYLSQVEIDAGGGFKK